MTILSGNQRFKEEPLKVSLAKRALIFLPGNANVYSIKEGDLHTAMVSKKRRKERKKE